MKKLIVAFVSVFALKSFASTSPAEIVDINSARSEIQAILGYKLDTTATRIDVDDNISAILELKLQFDPALAVQQADELRTRFPGYTIQRIVPSNASNFKVKIDELSLQIIPNVKQSIEGPYFFENVYLTNHQYSILKQGQSLTRLSGDWTLRYQKTSVVDQFDLPRSVCKSLIRNGQELGNALYVAYLFFLSPEMRNEIRDNSTFPIAVTMLMKACFEPSKLLTGSVEQMMHQEMTLKSNDESSIQIINAKATDQKINSEVKLMSNVIVGSR